MNQLEMHKILVTILLLLLLSFTSNPFVEVHAKTYSFTATISPTQINVNQLASYQGIITNLGESGLGSTEIAIPPGFTVLFPIIILNPTTLWNYTLTATTISISATEGGGVIPTGGNITFTFNAIAPTTPSLTNWTTQATTSIQGGGVTIPIEGEHPTVTVTSPSYNPPTIQASPTTINQGQTSLLSQLTGTSGGTPPYNYQWLEAFNEEIFTPITGANASEYTFSPTTLTPTGTWNFQLDVTDNSTIPQTITSNTIAITLNSALTAPQITSTPNQVTQTQTSTLNSSPITTGTSPYTYQWYQKAPNQNYTAVGTNSPTYIFPGSTTIGTWTFLVQVIDNTGATINSTSAQITITSTPSLTITVTQTAYGTINPGTRSISLGNDQSFTIAPDIGYYIADVLVDGVSIGAVTSYTFHNVTTSHSLTATFAPIEYTLTVSKIGEGLTTQNPNQTTYHYGDTIQLTATPVNGWRFTSWTGDITSSLNPSTITIDGNKEVIATFLNNQYIIIASATQGGQITPSGTTIVDNGENQTFNIIPNTGYHIENVLINGTNIGSVTSYTINNVKGDTTISASFAPNTFSITAQADPNGSINPTGIVSVNHGATQSFTISPDNDYYITDVLVDGTSIGPVTFYTFSAVTSDHTITANFAANTITYFINVTSQQGTATPSAQVNAGESFSVSVSSPQGETNHRWICTGYSIDGNPSISGTTYTFTNIQANHTITFDWQEQYYLTVDSPTGQTTGTGWYNSSTTTVVSVNNNTITSENGKRHIFTGWTGDATGTDTTSDPIKIDGPKTAIATWKTQYQVTYASLDNTRQETTNATEWVDTGTPTNAAFQKIITNEAGNTRQVLINENIPTSINRPQTITAIYQTQYLVTFMQDGLDPDAPITIEIIINGNKTIEQLPVSIWINAGDSITFKFITTLETEDEDMQYILASSNSTSPLTITEPLTIHGYYEPQPISSEFNSDTITLAAILATVPPSMAIPIIIKRRRKKIKKIKPITNKGGIISPDKTQKVNTGGDSIVFIMIPDPDYEIVDVVVDKTNHLGPIRTHKFVNVTQNHTISAIFQKTSPKQIPQ